MIQNRIGQRLIEGNLITQDQFDKVTAHLKKEGGRFFATLVQQECCAEADLMRFLSQHFRLPTVDLRQLKIDQQVIREIPIDVVKKYRVIPVKRVGNRLTVAMEDPSDVFAIDDIKFMTGYEIEPVLASASGISAAMDAYYDSANQLDEVLSGLDSMADGLDVVEEAADDFNAQAISSAMEEAPVVKLVNLILAEAIKKGASDVHIEAYEKKFRVRYRIDGSLYEVMSPPMALRAALTSRIKIMAQLDISERRVPQDGRIKLKMRDREVDLRVSTLPCLFGEKIVMRVLDKSNLTLDLAKLGFSKTAFERFTEAINSPWGMVLVTGPTGSGKTTTLYSALHQVNTVDTNIMTAEDPVEYNLMGINQVHVREEVGLTFPAALRSFLRQDPDIIMVGEIRDSETAEISVKAALTGHLVLSTLHTNDAPSTINRLLNMGIEPFLVASSVVLILAQRLARRICTQCKEVLKVEPATLVNLGMKPDQARSAVVYHGKGCPNCNGTGYRGRLALYEVLKVDESIRQLIFKGANGDEIKRVAVERGMETLRMNGIVKVLDGITTVDEVFNTTFAD
ncbi:MAG: type IV-A pilus assembly ATPase PilB [Nitrospirae bacterium]|nr:type IV-A pilus assembly ATPase PilB [Nitrospirota bacterium]